MHYPHPLIAREGWPFIAVLLVVAVGASVPGWAIVAVICWLVLAFVVQFFRDPPRQVPADAMAVLYGFIRFGSRVDVYLPLDVTPKVGPGDKVSATTTVLGVLAR